MTSQPFSARQGYRPEDIPVTIREDAPAELRQAILMLAESLGMNPHDIRGIICGVLLVRPDPNNWSAYPNVWHEVNYLIDGAHWYKVYDIAESFYARLMSDNPGAAIEFERRLNEFFLEKSLGWELRNGQITSRGSDVFTDNTNGTPQTREKVESQRVVNEMGEVSSEHLSDMDKKYHVALSFAGEQRDFVEGVAKHLKASNVKVFYDEFENNSLWGEPLLEVVKEVYAEKSRYVVLFVSEEYCSKAWPNLEANHSIMAALIEEKTTILPIRFDGSVLSSLPEYIRYIEIKDYPTPALIAKEICEKIGVRPLAGKASNAPPSQAKQPNGEVCFDYSSHNGRYVIGSGKAQFETMWSKGDGRCIHLYNDPSSIEGIAVARRDVLRIAQVKKAKSLNYTSRCRTVYLGRVAVLENIHGFFAAIRVLEIRDERYDDRDEVRFQYVIQEDGSDDFSNVDDGF